MRRPSFWTGMAAALALAAGGAAIAQRGADASAQLRATGLVGEQADGYLGLVGSAPANVRAQMDSINITRRQYYTDLAQRRGARIEEVAAATACEILASRVLPGQYYRLPGEGWTQREAGQPVRRPAYCG